MRRFAFVIWLILLFIATSIPTGGIPQVRVFGVDKIIHLFLYSVLTIFLFFSYGKRNWKFLFLVAIVALLDEVHQYYIPGRCMSIYDFGADMIGAGMTFWVLKV